MMAALYSVVILFWILVRSSFQLTEPIKIMQITDMLQKKVLGQIKSPESSCLEACDQYPTFVIVHDFATPDYYEEYITPSSSIGYKSLLYNPRRQTLCRKDSFASKNCFYGTEYVFKEHKNIVKIVSRMDREYVGVKEMVHKVRNSKRPEKELQPIPAPAIKTANDDIENSDGGLFEWIICFFVAMVVFMIGGFCFYSWKKRSPSQGNFNERSREQVQLPHREPRYKKPNDDNHYESDASIA